MIFVTNRIVEQQTKKKRERESIEYQFWHLRIVESNLQLPIRPTIHLANKINGLMLNDWTPIYAYRIQYTYVECLQALWKWWIFTKFPQLYNN